MPKDISHKKAINMIKVISEIAPADEYILESKYEKLRNEGNTRLEAVIILAREVIGGC